MKTTHRQPRKTSTVIRAKPQGFRWGRRSEMSEAATFWTLQGWNHGLVHKIVVIVDMASRNERTLAAMAIKDAKRKLLQATQAITAT